MSAETCAQPPVGCVVDADGRLTFDLPPGPVEGRHLLLRLRPKQGRSETACHVLDLQPAAGGRSRAVLGPGHALAEGRWDVHLRAGSREERSRPGPRDLRALVAGHLRDRPAPVAVRIPYVTQDGYLAIRAWLRPAHAEADTVGIGPRSLTVGGRLHGTSLGPGSAVRLLLRGGDAECAAALRAAGDERSFELTVDHAELTRLTGGRDGIWDVFVRPSAQAEPVRLARLLDDVADRKAVFVYPPATVDGTVLRPYYTVDNDFSVEVRVQRSSPS